MPRAVASHILVPTEQMANDLKTEIEGGADFGALARKHSKCPSGKQGGSLGEFGKGAMVPEFDRVVFSDLPIGQVSEPVKTQFGWHLLKVEKRMG
ncbi:MAG: peptidylprolyl isomerase [Phycisphaeraceae bacterium]|nr:peptidylprolyl isomerase [Phycisphaerales bacterium]MCA9306091.1 peptidylprolyl isomerase [Phycisphaerales bacterium]MCB9844230.1 peptidylprolyl isomerase [Phycisphaeraceae bacterium]